MPDAACKQSRDQVKAAAANAGMSIGPRRLTVNLSPASMLKAGSAFDLANVAKSSLGSELRPRVTQGSQGLPRDFHPC